MYAESAPHSNPVLTEKSERKYSGIGAALIAFGIKYSIDNGCRGDVVFDAKTDELAEPHTEALRGVLGLRITTTGAGGGVMLADEEAGQLFLKNFVEEVNEDEAK